MNEQHMADRLLPPLSAGYHLGTDNFGRDLLSQILYGAQMSLIGAVGVVIVSILSGTLLGVIAGYSTTFQFIIMRTIDALMAFPPLLMAMVLVTVLGQGIFNVIIAIGVYFMTRMTRIVYGLTLRIKEENYIEACKVQGAKQERVIFLHILPNLISPIIIQATFTFSSALLQMAALDYLGLGIPPTIPTWGAMLNAGKGFMTSSPWLVLVPGLVIVLTVLSLNIVGDFMRDNADPKFKQLVKGDG
jgi:peptide/nickel transport system permease protein